MPWTTDTFLNRPAMGEDRRLLTALVELCRAVNEREDVLEITKTKFWTDQRTLKSYIEVSDVEGFILCVNKPRPPGSPFGDPTSPGIRGNLEKIQSAIVAMVGAFRPDGSSWGIGHRRFTKTSEPTEGQFAFFWDGLCTVEWLEEEIGHTLDMNMRYARATDPVIWQTLRDALDLLIYVRQAARITIRTETHPGKGWYPLVTGGAVSGLDTTLSGAWSEMRSGGTFDLPTNLTPVVGYNSTLFNPSLFSSLAFMGVLNLRYENSIPGVCTGITYAINTISNGPVAPGHWLNASFGSVDFSIPTSAGYTTQYRLTANEDIPINGVGFMDFVMTSELPLSAPFNLEYEADLQAGTFGISSAPVAVLHADLTTHLTDQLPEEEE